MSDPNSNDKVKLTGHGGAFSAPPPVASLANTSGNGFSADFTWQTSCEHVALEPYRSTFRAEDNAGSEKMSNYKVYSIYVLPSAVKNVTAVPVGSDMNISWSLSSCFSIVNAIESYKIYRREGCAPFLHEPCQTGVAAESGFVFIGKTDNKTSGFTDDNAGDGLVVGQNYSYIVVAIYADGVESFASAPVCAKLKRDIPVVLNVDVLTTSATSGSVQIRWSRPLKTEGNLDTVALPGNYRFDLKYKSGSGYKTIFSSTAKYLFQLDTNYIHSPVNTTVDSNEYHVEFTAKENVVVGSSQKATSVFLNALGSDRKVELSWKSKTPWKNTRYTVFRKDPFSSGFSAIGTSTTNSFKDENRVANRNTYCYYVLAEGAYSDPTIYSPLLNRSQQVCVTPQDKTPPCTPTLSVDADCPSGFITVQWKNVRPICSDDVTDYLLYYKSTIEEPYAQILKTDSTYYQYDGSDPIAGCYAINAVDSAGNLSALSPDFCIDICPEFELPNIFSPNKDGANDFFKAVKVRQVKEIELVILDRWGNIVYKTKDPYFQWDGTHIQSKQAVSDGTFLYVCAVYEARVKGLVKRILKGTVQAVR